MDNVLKKYKDSKGVPALSEMKDIFWSFECCLYLENYALLEAYIEKLKQVDHIRTIFLHNISRNIDRDVPLIFKIFLVHSLCDSYSDFKYYVNMILSSKRYNFSIDDFRQVSSLSERASITAYSKLILMSLELRDRLRFVKKSINKKFHPVDALASEIHLSNLDINKKAEEMRLLICIGYLAPDELQTHFMFLKKRVKLLLGIGCNVDICFTGEHSFNQSFLRSDRYYNKFIGFHTSYWSDVTGNKPFFISTDEFKDPSIRFIELVNEVNPDLAVFLGSQRPRSSNFYRSVCFKKIPIIYLPTNINSQPVSYFDGSISGIDQYHVEMNKIHPNEKMSWPSKPPFEEFGDESDFDEKLFSDADFVVATPLKNNRVIPFLKKLRPEATSKLSEFFAKNPNSKWLFIGVDTRGEKEIANISSFFKNLLEEKRLVCIKATPKIRGLFRQCSVFFSVPGMIGGGGGASLAAYEGLPIITDIYSDSSAAAIKESIYSNVDDMVACLNLLANNKKKLDEYSLQTKEQLLARGEEQAIAQMKEAVSSIYKHGISRLRGA